MKKTIGTITKIVNKVSLEVYLRGKSALCNNKGVGLAEIIGIAALLIVAAFVLIPGLRAFAESVITAMSTWWGTTIQGKVFPTS